MDIDTIKDTLREINEVIILIIPSILFTMMCYIGILLLTGRIR